MKNLTNEGRLSKNVPSVISYDIKCNGKLSRLQCPRIYFSTISTTWPMMLFPAASSSSSAGAVTDNWMLQTIDGHVTLISCIGSRALYRTMFSQKLEFFVHMWARECGPIISDHTKQLCRSKRWLFLKPELLWSDVSSFIQRLLAELYWQSRLKLKKTWILTGFVNVQRKKTNPRKGF